MFLKPRYPSRELLILRSLAPRINLPANHRQKLINMEKGLEGENYFDEKLKKLPEEAVVLCDLLFEINNTHFQIDTLLLLPDVVYLFEVKHYEGDYVIKNDTWYNAAGYEIKNPLLQLKRNQSLLRQLFQKYRISLPVKAHLVFTNKNFYLYQVSYDLPILFPFQIDGFLSQWFKEFPPHSQEAFLSAEKLKTFHIETSPFFQSPFYTFQELKKGIRCPSCSSFLQLSKQTLVCSACGKKESLEKGVVRNIGEWKLLFPEVPLTSSGVHEWCGLNIDKRRIRRVLHKHHTRVGFGRHSSYR
ncbi:nuclease-related domain-containing protein [Salibacterium lacus]|uniref:Nuclease-related domain-containing protein n=1 Tax=Salibacterium lacus TaxID=1898109 RepID=A0ABW5T1M5_9BACI